MHLALFHLGLTFLFSLVYGFKRAFIGVSLTYLAVLFFIGLVFFFSFFGSWAENTYKKLGRE